MQRRQVVLTVEEAEGRALGHRNAHDAACLSLSLPATADKEARLASIIIVVEVEQKRELRESVSEQVVDQVARSVDAGAWPGTICKDAPRQHRSIAHVTAALVPYITPTPPFFLPQPLLPLSPPVSCLSRAPPPGADLCAF